MIFSKQNPGVFFHYATLRNQLSFIALPLMGGASGLLSFLAVAFYRELQNQTQQPALSYGQEAVLFTMPLCTVIGAVIGLGIALAMARLHALAICILLASGNVGCSLITSIWNQQIARYGRDASEFVLYYPPMAACAIAMLVAGVLVGKRIVSLLRR